MSARFRLLAFLSLCGLLINVLLLVWKLTDPAAGIAGCGGGGCGEVLASRWSQVFGLPLPALGIPVYVLLCAALLWRKYSIAAFGFASIAGSAVWFTFVQAVILRHFCPWCMAAHGVGGVIAVLGLVSCKWDDGFRRGLQAGTAASLGLALAQLYGPAPATHRIDGDLNPAKFPSGGVHALGNGRKIAFDDGRKTYDAASLPRLGTADAKHVLVEYFDYQCPACRTMSGYLSALVEKHPAAICVLMLPVPLDHGCNPSLPAIDAGHPGSCELTRIALAVWRLKPEAYPALHRAFLSEPPPDPAAALAFARAQVAPAQLDAAMRDPWIDQIIQADIADWVAFSGKAKHLPKLLITGKRILHGLPSGEADFIRVMEQELGL